MAMSLDDYKRLCADIVHMSCDIESECPRADMAEFDEECAAKYALVRYMLDCINDVPASLIEGAIADGVKLPEAEY